MAIGVTSGGTRTGLPVPTSKQSVINGVVAAVNTGTAVYAVPANKTFYATSITFSSGSAALAIFKLNDGTSDYCGVLMNSALPLNLSGGILFAVSGGAGGLNITIAHGAGAGNGYCSLSGWIE